MLHIKAKIYPLATDNWIIAQLMHLDTLIPWYLDKYLNTLYIRHILFKENFKTIGLRDIMLVKALDMRKCTFVTQNFDKNYYVKHYKTLNSMSFIQIMHLI